MFLLRIISDLCNKYSNEKHLRRGSIPNFSKETVSFRDPILYPQEVGPIQESSHCDSIQLPQCRIYEYVWQNMAKWHNHVAVVEYHFLKHSNYYYS